VSERLDREYFERLYSESRDPWDFETSEYERRKYERTLGILEGRRFRRALEVGASIGVFTAMLAPLCDELVAVDVSERAVAAAKERLARFHNVRLERRSLPGETPDGPFDLVVASEVLYYLPREQMLAAQRRFEEVLAPGGALLAVHWRKKTRTYPLQGDEVHELLEAHTRLTRTETIVEPEYRLDLFEDRMA
jgi:predicted TPR repeat methyltransferase